jgi:choline dehydrogenase-like flavoprotein
MTDSRHDIIVIGSGAGGGTLAHRLAPSGKKVLILERGDWLPREARNWSVADVFGDGKAKAFPTGLELRLCDATQHGPELRPAFQPFDAKQQSSPIAGRAALMPIFGQAT